MGLETYAGPRPKAAVALQFWAEVIDGDYPPHWVVTGGADRCYKMVVGAKWMARTYPVQWATTMLGAPVEIGNYYFIACG